MIQVPVLIQIATMSANVTMEMESPVKVCYTAIIVHSQHKGYWLDSPYTFSHTSLHVCCVKIILLASPTLVVPCCAILWYMHGMYVALRAMGKHNRHSIIQRMKLSAAYSYSFCTHVKKRKT